MLPFSCLPAMLDSEACWVNVKVIGASQVGQLIQSKGGVVTAEQLAPFLDVTPDDLEKVDGYTNESYVVRHYPQHTVSPQRAVCWFAIKV